MSQFNLEAMGQWNSKSGRLNRACLGALCDSLKMCGLDASTRPWLSYVSLITVALLSSPSKRLTISEIYAFIEQTFPYYRHSRVNWRNSVRHNLSLNDCFIKVSAEDGKRRGHYWTLHPDCFNMFDHGSLLRRHRRFRRSETAGSDPHKHNASVMPILQKISDELTRWKTETLSMPEYVGDGCCHGDFVFSDCAVQGEPSFFTNQATNPSIHQYPNYYNQTYAYAASTMDYYDQVTEDRMNGYFGTTCTEAVNAHQQHASCAYAVVGNPHSPPVMGVNWDR